MADEQQWHSSVIGGVPFEWHLDKAELVFREHKVTMAECATVLLDESVITKQDYRDYGEERFISTGYSNQARTLTVVWTPKADKIRLIIGFKATKHQIKEFKRG